MSRIASLNSELLDACISAINRAGGPMTVAQVASVARGGKGQSAKLNRELAEELGRLPENSGVAEWPKYSNSRIFWKQPFRGAVEEAFVKALDAEPLTVPKAAEPVSKLLRRASKDRALAELKTVAPQLAAANRILQVELNRQSVVYLSFTYLERRIPARGAEFSIADAILESIGRLQPSPGSYVRIDSLRNAPELRKPLDEAAVALARKGKLVLARYDGPRPVPEEDKWYYVQDERGELYIGAALPRGERVIA